MQSLIEPPSLPTLQTLRLKLLTTNVIFSNAPVALPTSTYAAFHWTQKLAITKHENRTVCVFTLGHEFPLQVTFHVSSGK